MGYKRNDADCCNDDNCILQSKDPVVATWSSAAEERSEKKYKRAVYGQGRTDFAFAKIDCGQIVGVERDEEHGLIEQEKKNRAETGRSDYKSIQREVDHLLVERTVQWCVALS